MYINRLKTVIRILRKVGDRDSGRFHSGGTCDVAVERNIMRGGKSFGAVEHL